MLEPTDATLAQLKQLGMLHCTEAEAAAYIGVSLDELTAFLAAHGAAADAFERGRLVANVVLRQRQNDLAKTSTGMAIHLAKERLKDDAPTPAKKARRSSASIVPSRGHRRPAPPLTLVDELTRPLFQPAPDVTQWLRLAIIADTGPIHNPEHDHLIDAAIGVLWTNVGNGRAGRRIVGQAELGTQMGGAAAGRWAKARTEMLLTDWFGEIPDFVITLDANYAAECDDASFCALIEHELYHCAQERDPFGLPKFRKDGRPAYCMRGHDVEEFVGVVRRYGAAATGVSDLVEAANRAPEIASAQLFEACGTCQAKRAA